MERSNKMGYTWMVIEVESNGKSYAWAHRWLNTNNLLSVHEMFPSARSIMICDTKKRAKEIANAWNSTATANGTYMY